MSVTTPNYTTRQGAFTAETQSNITNNFRLLFGGLFQVGNVYYLDPLHGSDTNNGLSATTAYQSLAVAYGACVSGNNDTVVLISDGTTSSTARIDATFTWSKNNTNLVGIGPGVNMSNRARMAPTGTTTAFASFFVISGSGCNFSNVQWFDGFNTGTTAQICLTITGSHNYFNSCHIVGMGDSTSAASSTSRSIVLTGPGGENQFNNCTIGVDTVARTTTNASVEFTAGTVRNLFKGCRFLAWLTGSGSGAFHALAAAASSVDRNQIFEDCSFEQSITSGLGVAMAELAHWVAGAGGQIDLIDPRCIGVTAYGDTATKAELYIVAYVVSKTGGLGVVGT